VDLRGVAAVGERLQSEERSRKAETRTRRDRDARDSGSDHPSLRIPLLAREQAESGTLQSASTAFKDRSFDKSALPIER
jgi:hypothetical protein